MDETGIVFNIQKFSVNDGPGIRTTVFLKGCPLRCTWCANPESQLPQPQVLWDAKKCQGCLRCVRLAQNGEIAFEGGRIAVNDGTSAAAVEAAHACPAHALTVEGERKTVAEVMEVIEQDRPFYEESGGGVTLSGGEPLMQADFACALLAAAQGSGIRTAVETTGYVSPAAFERALPHLDLLLFDIKHWDATRHRTGTGVTNELPLANMKAAIAAGKDVLPRLPVIPGFNDSRDDVDGFVRRLKEVGAKRVQLLPFHQFGARKYQMLERSYAMEGVPQLHREDLTAYRDRFTNQGIDAFF